MTSQMIHCKRIVTFLLLLFLINGCDMFEGAEGPQGEQGPQGVQGVPGADGAHGAKGEPGADGNANVIVKTITINNQNYSDGNLSAKHSDNSLYFFPAKIADIEDPDITQSIVDNGLVLAYIEVPVGLSFTPTQWITLPYSYRHLNQIYTVNYTSTYRLNTFSLQYFFTRNMAGTMPDIRNWNAPTNKIRYVIISGSVAGRMASSRLDLGNFEAVLQFLKSEGVLVGSLE